MRYQTDKVLTPKGWVSIPKKPNLELNDHAKENLALEDAQHWVGALRNDLDNGVEPEPNPAILRVLRYLVDKAKRDEERIFQLEEKLAMVTKRIVV